MNFSDNLHNDQITHQYKSYDPPFAIFVLMKINVVLPLSQEKVKVNIQMYAIFNNYRLFAFSRFFII